MSITDVLIAIILLIGLIFLIALIVFEVSPYYRICNAVLVRTSGLREMNFRTIYRPKYPFRYNKCNIFFLNRKIFTKIFDIYNLQFTIYCVFLWLKSRKLCLKIYQSV